MLWFDVGIKRYTTEFHPFRLIAELWFDVGIKRYTTDYILNYQINGCGLM